MTKKTVLILLVVLAAGVALAGTVIDGIDSTKVPRSVLVDTAGRIATYKDAIGTMTPLTATGVTVAGTPVVVMDATEIYGWPNWCITLRNAGGAGGGPMTDVDVQVSPDGTNWVSLTWTSCDAITSGSLCTYCVSGSSYRHVRARATAAAAPNNTTVDAWLTANRG